MSRFFGAAIMMLMLASCAGGNYSAPRNLDNACSIIQQRPQYLKAMAATERRWGVPVAVQMATIYQESKFIGNAKTPHRYAMGIIPMGRQSSAYGYAQALDGTWDEYRQEQRRFGAKRDRISDATDFMGWYMHQSSERLGISKSDTRMQYLAYHEGRSGFARGSYRNKPWLMDVAGKLEQRALRYHQQLQGCRRG
jgi:hypothetical protein